MDIFHFRTRKLSTIDEIFNIHQRDVKRYLVRMFYDQAEYDERRIQFTWRRLALCIVWTSYNWFFLANYIVNLQLFKDIIIVRFEVKRPEYFILLLIMMFIVIECFWATTFKAVINYDYPKLEVVANFQRHLSLGHQKSKKQGLVHYYNRMSLFSSLMLKASAFLLSIMLISTASYLVSDYLEGNRSFIMMLYRLIATISFLYSVLLALSMMFILMVHMFFVLQIFRLQTQDCITLLLLALNLSYLKKNFLIRFLNHYIVLFKNVSMYNHSIRHYLFYFGAICRFSGAICITFYSKQDKVNFLSAFVLVLFVVALFYYEYVVHKVSYFANKNLIFYRHLYSLNLNLNLAARSPLLAENYASVRMSRCKINFFIQMLGEDEFGFSFGKLEHISKLYFFNSFVSYLYLLALYYKQMRI